VQWLRERGVRETRSPPKAGTASAIYESDHRKPATSAPRRITSDLELLGKAGPVQGHNKGNNSFFPLALGWQRPSGPSSPVKDPCRSPPLHRNPALARPGCCFSARGASFASESSPGRGEFSCWSHRSPIGCFVVSESDHEGDIAGLIRIIDFALCRSCHPSVSESRIVCFS
jgi:hypothetical protein